MVLTAEKKDTFTLIRTNLSKLNYENANKFSKQTVDIIENEQPQNLAIDCQGITYLSSIGISALSIIKGISEINKCTIVLFNISPIVLETLEQTGINTLFKLLDSEMEVIEYFKDTTN